MFLFSYVSLHIKFLNRNKLQLITGKLLTFFEKGLWNESLKYHWDYKIIVSISKQDKIIVSISKQDCKRYFDKT